MIKYIEKIQLKNFQSHKDTTIYLDPRLNIIVGESDSGKTAILRAIKWVLYNEPLGDFFIKQGETECSVKLSFNDKVEVERYRSNSKNQYKLKLANGEYNTFEGFGANVPEEIIMATGIRKIELDQNESRTINLGEQLEGAFLLSEKDSIKASSIGRLVGVNIIDDALRQGIADNRNLNIEKNRIIDHNEKLKEEFKKYEYLKELESKLNELNIIKNKINEKLEIKEKLEKNLLILENIYNQKKEIALKLSNLKNIDVLENQILNISINLNKYMNLQNLNIKYFKNYSDLKNIKKNLEKLKDLDILECQINKIENQNKDLNNYKIIYNKFNFINLNKNKINEKLDGFKYLNELFLINNNIENKVYLLNEYDGLFNKYLDTKKRINYGEIFYSKFKEIENIKNINEKLNNNIMKLNKLEKMNKDFLRINQIKEKENKEIIKIKEYSKKLLYKYKIVLENQKICPMCSSVLDKDHIDKVIKEYMEDIDI